MILKIYFCKNVFEKYKNKKGGNKGGGSIVWTRAIEEGRNIKVAQPARFELRPVNILSHSVFLMQLALIGTVPVRRDRTQD